MVSSEAPNSQFSKAGPICSWTNGIAQHSPQAIEFDPHCLGKAYSNKTGTDPEYENASGYDKSRSFSLTVYMLQLPEKKNNY